MQKDQENKKVRHSETEMVKAVQSLEKGTSAEEVTCTYGISKGTLYNWKSKYGGISASLGRADEDVRNITDKWMIIAITAPV